MTQPNDPLAELRAMLRDALRRNDIRTAYRIKHDLDALTRPRPETREN